MADPTEVSVDAGRPDPAAASTAAEFVEAMRSLKRWTGWGFRQLEKRATAGGHALPRSTLTVALSRDTLPREELVAAFAHACGCDEDETARWIAARRRIAAAGDADPLAPAETAPAPAVTRPRGRLARLVAACVVVAAAVVYLVGQSGPSDRGRGPDRAAPETPGTSRTSTPAPEPGGAPASTAPPGTTPGAGPGEVVPAAVDVPDTPGPTAPPGSPAPQPPPTDGTPPPGPGETGRETVELPGQAPIHCPVPYLVTGFGPLAQCTQVSGDKARVGYYSPVTGVFNPTVEWLPLVESTWYEGSLRATDGVTAESRGYAVVDSAYGAVVFTTQYRDGEARWGTYNLVTNQFYPADQGWQPVA